MPGNNKPTNQLDEMMLRDVDWLLPNLTHPTYSSNPVRRLGAKAKEIICIQKRFASGGAERLLGDTCIFGDSLIIPFVFWIMGFYRRSAGNLLNSRNNSFQ